MTSFQQRAAARAAASPGAEAGIDEGLIARQVHAFYGRVRQDPELGPIFETAVGDHWDAHVAKLCDFWSSVLLATGRFRGSPMAAHARLPDLGQAHFNRWLDLWRGTARALCPPLAADLFIVRAEMIAHSLQLGLAAARGELPAVRPPPAPQA